MEKLFDDLNLIEKIHETNKKYLSSREGAKKVMEHVEKVTEMVKKVSGLVGVMGVGYPYYFVSDGVIRVDPAIIHEYINYNNGRSSKLKGELNGDTWDCPSCQNFVDSRSCCKGSAVTVYEVMRSTCDADIFIVLGDSDENEFNNAKEYIKKLVVGNSNFFRTWDRDLVTGIDDYINGRVIFSDIHIITTSQLAEALDYLELFIHEALSEEQNQDKLTEYIRKTVNDISWRGHNIWDETHKLPLVWDLLISARFTYIKNMPENIKKKLFSIGCILGGNREKCERVLKIATKIFRNNEIKEFRFVHLEEKTVVEAMIDSLLSAFPTQES